MKIILLEKEYSSEELCDLERDVNEMFQFPEDSEYKTVKKDKYGFEAGTYKVLVTYEEE